MAIGLAALGLLAFLLCCSGTFAEPQNSECSLIGIWKNDLNSTIEINSVSDTGVFNGTFSLYPTPRIRPYPLQGKKYQWPEPQWPNPTFGFTCFVDKNGKEQLRTNWLQREKVGSAADDWQAIRLGGSTFYRSK
ncbi:avidin-related protein 1-like [Protobothrops mucrosquamatus]|uniref:avidin-related protein 1-like n=1 Tax=Protobothrops mucrosquamatus TaxID=103944 RepID=UPI000775DBF5|nr:avidin-related protein 1-like [Protobothrops mucrosquamatus]